MTTLTDTMDALALLVHEGTHRPIHLPRRTGNPLRLRGLARKTPEGAYVPTPAAYAAHAAGTLPKIRSAHGTTWARIKSGHWASYNDDHTFHLVRSNDSGDLLHWKLRRDDTPMRRIYARSLEDATDIASIEIHWWRNQSERNTR